MVPTEQITEDRLGRWTKRLSDAHATPVVLVALGHDHNKGLPVVCTTEDIGNQELSALLRYAASALDE